MILNKKQVKIGTIIFLFIFIGFFVSVILFVLSINPDHGIYFIYPLSLLACSPIIELYNILQKRKSITYNLILRIKKFITKKSSTIKKWFIEELTLRGLKEIFIIEPFDIHIEIPIKELDPYGEEDWEEKDYETMREKVMNENPYGIEDRQPPPYYYNPRPAPVPDHRARTLNVIIRTRH